jgi:hypothetical protein
MAKKPRKFDPKAKAKKQKKMAIAGFVLLLALVAYQGPKTMKLLSPPPPPSSAPATTTPAPVAPGAAPTPKAKPTPVTPAPSGRTAGSSLPASPADSLVVNADLSPVPLDGQLAALTQFTSKDPFKQQVVSTTATSSGSTSTPTTSTTTTPSGSSSGSFTPGPGSTSGSPTSGSTTHTPSATVATISVNGVEMAVTVKTDFPADSPFFHLVSLTPTTAKIAIAGGTLATGSTLTLKKGKAVTLMNTADGTRYILVLISMGDTTTPAAAGPAGTTTVPATTTPAGTSTTPTTTKPGG